MSKTRHKYYYDEHDDSYKTKKNHRDHIKDKRLQRALKKRNIDAIIDIDEEW